MVLNILPQVFKIVSTKRWSPVYAKINNLTFKQTVPSINVFPCDRNTCHSEEQNFQSQRSPELSIPCLKQFDMRFPFGHFVTDGWDQGAQTNFRGRTKDSNWKRQPAPISSWAEPSPALKATGTRSFIHSPTVTEQRRVWHLAKATRFVKMRCFEQSAFFLSMTTELTLIPILIWRRSFLLSPGIRRPKSEDRVLDEKNFATLRNLTSSGFAFPKWFSLSVSENNVTERALCCALKNFQPHPVDIFAS